MYVEQNHGLIVMDLGDAMHLVCAEQINITGANIDLPTADTIYASPRLDIGDLKGRMMVLGIVASGKLRPRFIDAQEKASVVTAVR